MSDGSQQISLVDDEDMSACLPVCPFTPKQELILLGGVK